MALILENPAAGMGWWPTDGARHSGPHLCSAAGVIRGG